MHFTVVQYQDLQDDSLVSGAQVKLYKNFSDFDADTAIAVSGTTQRRKVNITRRG